MQEIANIPSPQEIKKYRLKLGITQKELAEKAGVSQGLIARIERGTVDPRVSTLSRIIKALKNTEIRKRSIKARDIMKSPVIFVTPEKTVKEASDLMERNDISQLPIFKNGVQLGSISEDKIIHMLALGRSIRDISKLRVKDIMDDGFPIVSANTELETLISLVESNPAILVVEKEKIVGIITKSDLVNLMR